MRHPLHQEIKQDDIVIISKPGEQLMWREKTPEEKLASKFTSSKDKSAANLFAGLVKKINNF